METIKRVLERRFTPGEVELRDANGVITIEGHAAIFDVMSEDLGGFKEVVTRSAFNKTIREADVRALINHDENLVLGRTSAGTLDLSLDTTGLLYRIRSGNRSYERDLHESMERRDIKESSFAFFKISDDWSTTERDYPLRSLLEVSLVDVSPVTYPAYLRADSGLGRAAALESLAKRSGYNVTDLGDIEAIRKAIAGDEPDDQETSPDDESSADSFTHDELRAAWIKQIQKIETSIAEESVY